MDEDTITFAAKADCAGCYGTDVPLIIDETGRLICEPCLKKARRAARYHADWEARRDRERSGLVAAG